MFEFGKDIIHAKQISNVTCENDQTFPEFQYFLSKISFSESKDCTNPSLSTYRMDVDEQPSAYIQEWHNMLEKS